MTWWQQFLPRDATQSAVMPQYVVCLSVCPQLWSDRKKLNSLKSAWGHVPQGIAAGDANGSTSRQTHLQPL